MPGWEFMVTVRSEVGEKQDTPTGRVTLGSETRVITQNAKALFSSWHRLSRDLALSSICTSGTSCCYLMEMVGKRVRPAPSTEI